MFEIVKMLPVSLVMFWVPTNTANQMKAKTPLDFLIVRGKVAKYQRYAPQKIFYSINAFFEMVGKLRRALDLTLSAFGLCI